MIVKIAKNAGFCFGVKRAMKMAWDELESTENNNEDVYALGPLIHNKQAVSKYEEKGLITVDDLYEIPDNKKIIIRSHGVAKSIYDNSENKHLNIVDTTCPFVKKIHNIVNECQDKGYEIIVIGDSKHPEVIGINGWCQDKAIIIKKLEDIEGIKFDTSKKYCVVAQTTINVDLYEQITDYLKESITDLYINNTICSATKVRQQSAKTLSQEVDCMVVIGGKHSSNTQKLVNICKDIVPTFAVETKDELSYDMFSNHETVGVTAGASTPDWIISEVIEYLENL